MSARITVIPTSHIARESSRLIREAIGRERPDCIAVELDENRLRALKEGEASAWYALRTLGPLTFIFYFVLKNIQQSLGKAVGISPGSEMLEAVSAGRQEGIRVALIDRDIGETFLGIKAIPAKEKVRLLSFLLMALVGLGPKQPGKINLAKVPPEQVVDAALGLLKKEFPWLYRILIEERDAHMARRILELSQTCQNIVVVVGAGHAKGIREILEKKQEPSFSYSFTAD
ncbi:MAG TPA: TraB/GumN family protein [archaeon]|nr:TraB/GumN family protein [archaeon]